MDRRETLKSIFVGSIAGGVALTGCATEEVATKPQVSTGDGKVYGRTAKERLRDEKINASSFFNAHEMETVAVLCDLILPSSATAGSAGDAEVPAFIEFIVKDLPNHQIPLRGGIMWLDHRSNSKFDKEFVNCDEEQKKYLLDEIAFPEEAHESVKQGVKFFSLMRNLTMTGYYTTKMGFEDLGYVGNQPNVWDGVPEDVLKKHNMEYEAEWLAKCVDQSKRAELAKWDDAGNLLT